MRINSLAFWLLVLFGAVPASLAVDTAQRSSSAWRQWGGPGGDFRIVAEGLADRWSETGPEVLWERELGEGQSAILFEAGLLYTMYRVEGSEVVVSLDAASGEPVWEHRYPAEYEGLGGYGSGPRSTPALAGERLFSIGVGGTMLALDKRDGRVLWRRELWGPELGGNVLGHGYASSPVVWGDLVIAPVGGVGTGLVAFDQASGDEIWRSLDSRNSYSSPRVVELLGREQLVAFMAEEIVGVAPATGELLWRYPHSNQWGHNIAPPKVVGDDTVFISSPQAGARALRLMADGDAIEVEQLWKSRRVQFYHGTTVVDGDWVYGSTGTLAPAFMTAVNARNGEVAWRRRGFAKANCLGAGSRLLILDEDGILYLADASPEGIEVISETRLLDHVAWTVPTVVGRTLWVRNQERILAVDLGVVDLG